MRKILLSIVVALAILAGALVIRTLGIDAPPPAVAETSGAYEGPPADSIAGRLSRALQFRTISNQDSAAFPDAEFVAFRSWLEQAYPRVHAALQRDIVGRGTLLYTWTGSDAALEPVVLMSHQDVVPVDPASESRWSHPPYSGAIAEGYVWGRGAIDDKAGVILILEAVETLLAQGATPSRTVYLVFGHDEEVGGSGARATAQRMQAAGVTPLFVLDEGGAVFSGTVQGVQRPVALVGVAEKGYLTLELSVESTGGHSSAPPVETAVGILAGAIDRLERNPFPMRIDGATGAMLQALAPEMPFVSKMAFANLWLLEPLVRRELAKTPGGAAMMRTTTAPTMLEGSVKENVLPARARAVVNFRLLPGDGSGEVIARVREVVGDERVAVRVLDSARIIEASPEAPTGGAAFAAIRAALSQAWPEALVSPYLVTGATDGRHFTALTPSVYRFLPITMGSTDLARFHGTDERVSIASLEPGVTFYATLLRQVALAPGPNE